MNFKTGQSIVCINVDAIKLHDKDNHIKPPLELNKPYVIKEILVDAEGNQHLDVGLISKFNYIRSVETKEELDRGEDIHWCHPSRFKPVS